MAEIEADVPELLLMLWFDVTPKTPKEWAEQPADLWETASAYQSAYLKGQALEREAQSSRQDVKRDAG